MHPEEDDSKLLDATLATARLREICQSKDTPNMLEVAHLLEAGANVNDHAGLNNYSLLHLLVESGHLELARHLIGKGADLEHRATDSLKNTPVLYATYTCVNTEMAKLFIECGANLLAKDSVGDAVLHNAGLKGLADVAEHTVSARIDVDPSLRNNNKRSALGNGAFNAHKDFVSALLRNGWPVDHHAMGYGEDAKYYYKDETPPAHRETFALVRNAHTAAYDRWIDFWQRRDGDVLTLTREDICSFANADLHCEPFDPDHWQGKGKELKDLLGSLPPWLSRDIIEREPRITALFTPPDRTVKPWNREVHGRIMDAVMGAPKDVPRRA